MSVKSQISMLNIAWLAGILEGEGYFGYHGTPRITLKMIDLDVVQRVASLFNVRVQEHKKGESHHQQIYFLNIHGSSAIEWMFTIYSLMGKRRQNKIKEIINLWKIQNSRSEFVFGCGDPKTPENTIYDGRYKRCRKCKNERYRLNAS